MKQPPVEAPVGDVAPAVPTELSIVEMAAQENAASTEIVFSPDGQNIAAATSAGLWLTRLESAGSAALDQQRCGLTKCRLVTRWHVDRSWFGRLLRSGAW